MTGELFNQYLQWFDKHVASKYGGAKVVLLLDNAPAHKKDITLRHTRVEFLPPNVTSIVQPMDMGIIKTLKTLYRSKLLRKKLHLYEAKDGNCQVTVRDAITMVKEAWDEVSKPCIINCFVKAGFDVARIRSEQMDEEAALEAERIAEEAARQQEEAVRLIGVQVVRFNNVVVTNPELQLQPEEFIEIPSENNVHPDYETQQVGDAGDAADGAGPSMQVTPAEEDVRIDEESEEEEEEVQEIDTSRKRMFQIITDLETHLQFLEVDGELKRGVQGSLDKLVDRMERDRVASLKQKTLTSYFTMQ